VTLRASGAVVLLGLVAAVLGGCGGTSNPEQAVTKAAKTTLGDTAATMVTLTDPTLFGKVHGPVSAPGVFGFPTGLGYEAVHLDNLVGRQAQTDYLFFLGNDVYLEPHPAKGSVLPNGKLWLHASLAEPENPTTGAPPGFAGEAMALSPALALSELEWGAKTVSPGKRVVVDHVPYTEYLVTVDLEQALAGVSGSSAPALRAAIRDQLAALRASRGPGAHTIEITTLLDGPGHVVRLETTPPGAGLGTTTTQLGNFGTPLGTDEPPASDVIGIRSATKPGTSPWRLGES
jgi:hypothetical protein